MEQAEGRALSQSIQRAIDVLEFVARRPDPVSVTELAAALHLPKSTAHRLLANLQARSLIEQDVVTERYRPGLGLFTLGAQVLDHAPDRAALRSTSHQFLQDLVQRVGETVYLGILDRGEVLYIDSIEGSRAVRAASPTGTRRPVHCTAVGKVLLSQATEDLVERLLGRTPLAPRTAATVTEPADFRARLTEVRQQGYALEVGEFEEGLACMAAPVFGHDGSVVAAVGLTGPAWRLVDERLESVIRALRQTARAVSAEMGYRPTPEKEACLGIEQDGRRSA